MARQNSIASAKLSPVACACFGNDRGQIVCQAVYALATARAISAARSFGSIAPIKLAMISSWSSNIWSSAPSYLSAHRCVLDAASINCKSAERDPLFERCRPPHSERPACYRSSDIMLLPPEGEGRFSRDNEQRRCRESAVISRCYAVGEVRFFRVARNVVQQQTAIEVVRKGRGAAGWRRVRRPDVRR